MHYKSIHIINFHFSLLSNSLSKLVKLPALRSFTYTKNEKAENEENKDNQAPVSLHLNFQRCGGGHSE